jgi:hypothetical protein
LLKIKGREQRRCPPEFQDRITRSFGRNRFGEPNFKIVWAQSEFMRMGNVWRDVHGNERHGYRDVYALSAQPCWVIMRWRPPEDFGTPDLYYYRTWDDFSKLYITGEYPWKGRYVSLVSLHRKTFVNGNLIIDSFPLSHVLIDKLLPMMIAAKQMTYWERKAAQDLAMQRKNKQDNELAANLLEHHLPAFMGAVSYTHQGCKTSVLAKKEQQIQDFWNRMSHQGGAANYQKGFFQGTRPRVLNPKSGR